MCGHPVSPILCLNRSLHPLATQVKKRHELALIEAQILRDVNDREREQQPGPNIDSLCVNMVGHFEHQGHCCLVFERLGLSLCEYLKTNNYRGFTMDFMRPIARELFQVRSGPLLPTVSTELQTFTKCIHG